MKKAFIALYAAAGLLILYALISKQLGVALLWTVVAIGWLVVRAILASGARRSEAIGDSAAIKPFVLARDEIAAIATSADSSPEARHIAQELLQEAEALLAHARHFQTSLASRGAIVTARVKAENDLALIELNTVGTEAEDHRRARSLEVEHYRVAEHAINEGWSRFEEALASLTEVQARLVSGSIQENTEITGMVERIKTLSKSFDEAVETTRVNS